ncbi:SMODS domain-containing nucleotidyltransferase [Microbacterium sp. 1P10AE]|uniref:SMODS domain-containing nucleotidyltransferase n=1 Tax=Microbacterium sp. 1P10AE TaxID=3132286 RepID=UPI0039A11EC8
MATLSNCFRTALATIEPSSVDKINAPLAHASVRATLTGAETLREWGLSPVLIGSYKRDVSIRRVKDVDVFCRMYSIGLDVAGDQVLDAFFTVLDSEYGRDQDGNRRVRRQARSLQVAFPEFDGLYVDAVPARPRPDGYWEIPKKDSDDWQPTNPEQLTQLKTDMNASTSEMYVPTVKLLRQARRTILDSRPGGLFVELALYEACANGLVEFEDQALAFVTGLEAIALYLQDKFSWGRELPDPTMPGHSASFRATDLQWQTARDRFAKAAEEARAAYAEDDPGLAALAYRNLLGDVDDGLTVFPMPAGYNEDGTKKASSTPIKAGERIVPAGDRRFG